MSIETRVGGIECYLGPGWALDTLVAYGKGEHVDADLMTHVEMDLNFLTQENPERDVCFLLGAAYNIYGDKIVNPNAGDIETGRIVEDHESPNGVWVTDKGNICD